MNSTVTATGMQVRASVPESLLISKTSATEGFADTVTLENDVSTPNAAFTPTKDTLSGTTVTFEKLTADSLKHVNPDGTIATGYTATFEPATKDHYHDTIWLSLTGADTTNSTPLTQRQITVSATITDKETSASSDTIWKALHVGLVTANNSMVELEFNTLDTATAATNLVQLEYNAAAKQIEIYCWLDGEDTDCFNAASLASDRYEINLTFAFAS